MPAICRPAPAILLLLTVLCTIGCDLEQSLDQITQHASRPSGPTSLPAPALPRADGDTIRIASFNIQVFGTSKLKKQPVMDVLVDVVRQFDVVAIQEVRSKDQTVLRRFVEMINADGMHQYDYVIGPRLGRTISKEQYAFVFDAARIEADGESAYTAEDRGDYLHREPFVANFRVRGPELDRAFTFKLVNIHTDPDETDLELDALDDVFVAVQRDGSGEDDVILLGDLNVDERHLGELGRLPNIAHVIAGAKTNTRRTKSYDNIVLDAQRTTEYTGHSGVFDLMAEFGLTMDQALDVSDHMPVWAEFSAFESGGGAVTAARPGQRTQ